MKELLTASRMAALLGCMRKHFWRSELGLHVLVDAFALRFGSAWHAAMEARWQGAALDAALAAAVEGRSFDEVDLATLGGLLAGYYRRYGEDVVKELHPEVEFRHPIEGSRTFDSGGKIDGLGVLRDGRLALVEHKTTSESVDSASDYWLRLRLNQQVMQYVVAARALGWDVQMILYDVTRKPSIRPRQGETPAAYGERLAADAQARPEFYFARREVPVLDQDLEEFKVQRYELSKLILSLRQAERRTRLREQAWPRNVSGMNCQGCEFAGFCLQGVHVDAERPPAGFRVGPVHAELAQHQSPAPAGHGAGQGVPGVKA
jgi:hypothetical protein